MNLTQHIVSRLSRTIGVPSPQLMPPTIPRQWRRQWSSVESGNSSGCPGCRATKLLLVLSVLPRFLPPYSPPSLLLLLLGPISPLAPPRLRAISLARLLMPPLARWRLPPVTADVLAWPT